MANSNNKFQICDEKIKVEELTNHAQFKQLANSNYKFQVCDEQIQAVELTNHLQLSQ